MLFTLVTMSGAALSCTSGARPPGVSSGVEGTGGGGGHVDEANGGAATLDATSDAKVTEAEASAPTDGEVRDAPVVPRDPGCVSPIVIPVEGDGGASICPVRAEWGTGTLALVPSAPDSGLENDVFGSITYDELTIAWLSLAGGVPTLHYADRAASTDPFESPQTIFLSADYYAAERPALSPDGLRIVLVRSDRKGFGEYSRTLQFAAFTDLPSEAAFYDINRQGIMLTQNEFFGNPLISSDDRTFYYSKYDGQSAQTIFASTRTDDVPWLLGLPVAGELCMRRAAIGAAHGHFIGPAHSLLLG